MTGFRAAAKAREQVRLAAVQTARRGLIVSVERIPACRGGDPATGGAVAVRYAAHETRYLTRKQAERETEVWALCTWWH